MVILEVSGVDGAKIKTVSVETDFSYDFQALLLIRRDR